MVLLPVLVVALAAAQGLQQAMAHLQAGRVREARLLLERAVKLDPSSAAAWKLLGMAYAASGETESSVAPFRKACELNPKEEDACYYLGRNLWSVGRFEQALKAFETALPATPERKLWRHHRAVAQALEALGRTADAEKRFRLAIQLNRGEARPDEDPRIDYGVFLFRQGRTKDALGPLGDACKELPGSARAHGELGRTLLQLDRLEAAAARLEKAVALDPRYWTAHLLLGRAYLRLGRTKEGERELELAEKGLAAAGYGSEIVR